VRYFLSVASLHTRAQLLLNLAIAGIMAAKLAPQPYCAILQILCVLAYGRWVCKRLKETA
jgi:hypothetical protein